MENTGSTASAPSSTPDTSNSGSDNSSESVEGSEGGEAAAKPAMTPSQKKKFMLKIDGADVEDEVDLSDENELRNRFQKAKAADKRLAEAKAEKKKAFEIIQAFEKDPETMLKRLGPKGREIAEKFLLGQIKEEMLSPEEKERRAEKEELEQLRRERDEGKKTAEERAMQAREMEYAQSFQKTIIDALEKSTLPRTPEMVKRMAKLISKNLEHGLELSPEDLVQEVKKDVTTMLQSIIKDSDGDQLIQIFGADVANKIRKADLRKLQERQSGVFQNRGSQVPSGQPAPQERRPMTMDEWRESVERRIK